VITALPALTPVTTPDEDTVAIELSELLQLVTCPVMIAPVKSRAVASSSTALPTLIVAVDGWITTVAALAGGGIGVSLTVTAATAATPRNTATIDVLPAATAETRPCAFTFAMAGLVVAHCSSPVGTGTTLLSGSSTVEEMLMV